VVTPVGEQPRRELLVKRGGRVDRREPMFNLLAGVLAPAAYAHPFGDAT
jgi:hypothetical protein